jgi:putative endonuclease
MNHCSRGRRAEQHAAGYLRARAYRIWKSNWRWGKRELDLVALDGKELVIVEVKLMDGNRVNDPLHVVHPRKQRNIIWAAEAFIRIHRWKGPTRFDVISIRHHQRGMEIKHYRNAFVPTIE